MFLRGVNGLLTRHVVQTRKDDPAPAEIARCKRVMCLDELRVVALYFRCLTMDGFLIALVISRMILLS